jgi:hypothetical protein
MSERESDSESGSESDSECDTQIVKIGPQIVKIGDNRDQAE